MKLFREDGIQIPFKALNKETLKTIKGGSDSEPAVEEVEFACESWTLD